jgi:hypothetical protein
MTTPLSGKIGQDGDLKDNDGSFFERGALLN